MLQVVLEQAPIQRDSCTACGASIVWAVTDRGNRIAVTADQALPGMGTMILFATAFTSSGEPRQPYRVTVASAEQRSERPRLWLPHVVACPAGAGNRKPRPMAPPVQALPFGRKTR